MASEPPPAYNSLHTSTANIAVIQFVCVVYILRPIVRQGQSSSSAVGSNAKRVIGDPVCLRRLQVEDESVPNCNDGSELIVNSSFEDKTTRIGFIQKVLTIKLLQLLLMAIVMSIFATQQWEVRRSMRYSGVHIMVLSTLVFVATTGLLFYCTKARRENPYRYVFLIVHPITFAVFVCFQVVYWDFLGAVAQELYLDCPSGYDFMTNRCFNNENKTHRNWFIIALALAYGTYIAAVIAVLLYSAFTLQTKLEFSAKHAIFVAGFVQIITYASTVPVIPEDAIGVLYVSLFLCLSYIYVFWDLEYMTSVKYWRHITPENFVDGALNLHLDYFHILINIVIPQIRNKTNEFVHGVREGMQNHQ